MLNSARPDMSPRVFWGYLPKLRDLLGAFFIEEGHFSRTAGEEEEDLWKK